MMNQSLFLVRGDNFLGRKESEGYLRTKPLLKRKKTLMFLNIETKLMLNKKNVISFQIDNNKALKRIYNLIG